MDKKADRFVWQN